MTSSELARNTTYEPAINPLFLIDAIGRAGFYSEVLSFLQEVCGADHCAIFHLATDALLELGACSFDGSQTAHQRVSRYLDSQWWRKDPAISAAKCAIGGTGLRWCG